MSACERKAQKTFRAWCIMNGGKCHRVTFSEPLAKHIAEKAGPGYTLERRKFALTRPIDGVSRTGLYAIATTSCAFPLRISLIRKAAELMCDGDSRCLWECAPIG